MTLMYIKQNHYYVGQYLNETLVFECDYGYNHTDGDPVLICSADGWNGSMINCTGKSTSQLYMPTVTYVIVSFSHDPIL